MERIASELLVERLLDWGVDTVFGLPGDGINGVMEGLRRNRERMRFVLVHHEEAAAFMATGYAKATGRVGVCLATSGPGGIHLLNGLYDAKLDHVPVLAITGMQETQLLGTGYQQEVHLDRLFADVVEYGAMVLTPAHVPTLVDVAMRHALGRRGVAHITFPVDLQTAPADEPPPEGPAPARTPASAPVFFPAPKVPEEADLSKAAALLSGGAKVAILAGAGALGAREELLSVADTLAAPIVKTLPGKAAVPDDHPFTTGGIGLLGTKPSDEVMDGADTLLMVGTNFPYTKFLPEPGKVEVVQIEADPTRAGVRIPTAVPLVGDARATLAALAPRLERKGNRKFLESAQKSMEGWRRHMAALAADRRDPIQPQRLMGAIDELAAADAILTSDSGTIATWAARNFTIRDRREFYLSGNLATMAPGLPYAIGMQVAYPGRQCIAFVGDGGFSMLMAEVLTAVGHSLPVKVVICNNGALAQILWEQMVLGFPEFGVRQPTVGEYASFASANGALGIRVEKEADLDQAIAEALAHDGPAVVDVLVNPDEPPMPASVTYEQAKGFAQAFLRGQPRRSTIASTLFRDRIATLRGPAG